jgi:hypothetical protein
MKRTVFLGVFLIIVSFAVSAQGFYFDIGVGLGKGWTKVGGINMVASLKDAGARVNEIAVDYGFKAGYGPFGKIPLYAVGEFAGMGHRIYDSYNHIQFNSYIAGAGMIFYPIQLIQLGLSMGYSFVANRTDLPGWQMYDSKGGFAWNISAAVNFGNGNHGWLIGLKYFNANNTLKISNADEKASMVGIFIKYNYRKKAPSLFQSQKDK